MAGAAAVAATLAPMQAFALPAAAPAAGGDAPAPGSEVLVTGRLQAPLQAEVVTPTSITKSVQDTPQIVNVIPQELIQQQRIVTLEQALRDSPGITVAIGEGGTLAGDQFKIRGQDAQNDIYTDGLRDFGVYTRDSFDYQEVQVLKGPSGSMFGRGTTGGAINTVSKQPLAGKDFVAVDGTAGSGDFYRATVDLNHVLNETTALRINLMGTRSGVTDRDEVKSDRYGVAASIGFGLGTNTSLVVNYLHQQDWRVPDYGLVIGSPTGVVHAEPVSEYGVPQQTFEQFTNDRDRTRADILSAHAEWDVSPALTLTNDARGGSYDRYFQYTSVDSCAVNPLTRQDCVDALVDNNPATAPLITFGGGSPYSQRAWGVQDILAAHAKFDVGRFANEVVAGLDYNYQQNRKAFYAYTLPPLSSGLYLPGTTTPARNAIAIDLLTGAGAPPPGYTVFRPTVMPGVKTTGVPLTNITSNTYILSSIGSGADYAGFITDRFYVTPQVSLIAGVRYEDYKAEFRNLLVNGTQPEFHADSHLTSPRASLVYEPAPTQTYYVSYAKSAVPVGTAIVGNATPISGATQAFAPDEGETYEAGAKVAVLQGRLAFDGALFHVNKANATQVDPTSGMVDAQSSQKQTIKGAELGVQGQITPLWSVNVAYTYLDTDVRRDLACTTATATVAATCYTNPVTTGQPVYQAPDNSAFVWTSYRLSRIVRGLTVAGGFTYQDGFHVRYTTAGTAPNLVLTRDAYVPATFSLDGVLQYERGPWRGALNWYNLTDRLNYAQSFGNRAAPAQGRTFLVSVGRTF
ncbi:MAG: TonB-dependent receptor [Caulobacteraceae bacterium]|nr:TonB-dependent receptor [Caulobacter sp.]